MGQAESPNSPERTLFFSKFTKVSSQSMNYPFYFLRHGETQWNKDRICQGQMDSLLNDTGRAQAASAAVALKNEPIARIICSPLSRSRHTAEAVQKYHDLDIVFDDDLMEVNLGDHQGEPLGEWSREFWAGNYAPPNGETFQQFCDRVWAAMQRAIALGPSTLIVAHGGLLHAAHEFVNIEPEMRKFPNAQPLHITPSEGLWQRRVLGV